MTVLRQVIFPGALPHIMLGIRTGVGFAWRSLVAAELIGATLGLGQLIYSGMAFFRSDIVIGGCIMLGLLGLLTDRLILGPIERRTVERWGMLRRSRRECSVTVTSSVGGRDSASGPDPGRSATDRLAVVRRQDRPVVA